MQKIINILNMRTITLILSLMIFGQINAQDIDDLLNEASNNETNYTSATFKSTRIINGHSIENVKKNHLDFRISHRFGAIDGGIKQFFGIDQSTIHLSFEYGLFDFLTIGLGRSSYKKTYDGFLKLRLLRQSSGKKNIPVSLSYFGSTEIFSSDFTNPDRENLFSSRITYVHQLLIARKFTEKISLQITPTVIHKNLVPSTSENNDLFASGIGGRYKITKRLAVTAEYYHTFRNLESTITYFDPISIGLDIETGGHVFQLLLSNTSIMREGGFIYGTANDNFFDGGIHFGFNISRTFSF